MQIAGYRNALDEIHVSFEKIPISEETILHLHQVMTETAGYEGAGNEICKCKTYPLIFVVITVLLSNYGDNVWSRMRKIRQEVISGE